MLIRARSCGAFAVAILAVVISTGVPAHADEIPSPEPTVDVIDQPALPAGPIPSIEPTVPEGTFDPAPTEPVPTAIPTVAPPAPVGTPLESTRPEGISVEYFRSGGATTTNRGTGGEAPQDTAPAPQTVEPEVASASPTPAPATASPTPITATASPSPDGPRGDSAGSGAALRSTSEPRTPAPPLPVLILGMVVLAGGLLILRYRGPLYQAVAGTVKQSATGGPGERAGRLKGAFRLGVVGAVVALIGVTMNGYAAWQLLGSLSS